MRDILKKLSLALVVIAAVFMITGCPQEPKDETQHKVTITIELTGKVLPDLYVDDGETLESNAQFKAATEFNIPDYALDGFYTEDGKKFDTTKPITKDIKLIAKFKSTKHTVTLNFDPNDDPAQTYTVNDGDTLSSIQNFNTNPTKAGYTFDGFYTSDGQKFLTTTKITKDITLTAKFIAVKHIVTVSIDANSAAKKFEINDGAKLSSLTEFPANPTLNGYDFIGFYDGDEAFSLETPVKKDLTLIAKFSKKVDENTEETVSADGTKETTTTTEDEQGNTTVVTEKEDSEGNTTTTTTTTTTDEEGNTTTQVVTTDEDGNVIDEQTETTASDKATVESLINAGIAACIEFNVPKAISYFNAAYELDPKDDQAKVFSALVDLASISTNDKIAQFFKDHIGIQNYPATMSALINLSWLAEDSVTYTATDRIYWPSVIKENPGEYGVHYYRASRVSKPIDGEPVAFVRDNCVYQWKTINGKKYLFELDNEDIIKYEDRIANGDEYNLFTHNMISASSKSSGGYYLIDGKGDYYILPSITAYTTDGKIYFQFGKGGEIENKYNVQPVVITLADENYIEYTYETTVHMPVIDPLENENWFKNITKDEDYLTKLFVANIINGNGEGLDSAVDDLYDALFESEEYKSAIEKIDAVEKAVKVPSSLINMLGLTKFYGDNADVLIGKTELNLVKSLLDIFKGLFEYIQSYSFAVELDAIKESDLFTMDFSNETESMAFIKFIYDNKDRLDPFATGLLTVRDEEKMEAAQATFAGIIGDLIAAYDSIIGTEKEPSIYPSIVTGYASMGALYREGAELLQKAIEDGGVFYLPFGMEQEPTSWPTKAGDGIMYVDFGKVFTPGYFSLANLIETAEVNKKKIPVFYYEYWEKDANGKTIYHPMTKVTSAKDFEKITFVEDKDGNREYNGAVYFKHNIGKLLTDISNAIPYQGKPGLEIDPESAPIFYLFWYDK